MCTPARCRCLPTAKPFPPRCRHGTTRTLTPATVTTATGLPASPTHTSATFRLQPRGRPGHRFSSQISVTSHFQTSPSPSQLVAVPRRIEFVNLRTASSLPVALHPASLRRSYLQLRGLGLPRHGLPPCCVSALAGALGADSVGDLPTSRPEKIAAEAAPTEQSVIH